MDFVEVEVLQAQPVTGQQPGYRVGRRHQQAVVAVDIVDRGGLGIHEIGQRSQRVCLRPLFAGQQCHRGAVGQRSRIAGRHRRVTGLHSEDRTQRGQFLDAGVRPQIVVSVQP
ncbi:Uncharacterised protein [Mycobacterium tuberculosis]|uniref:Uncharacterized protein n=1 Tax=Mycobacterium tuberculosis TaxID=1773 RepID=A0A0U0R737_MYCTX|nr:Uncharacterised protein [Mycobacterium tuberculosis]